MLLNSQAVASAADLAEYAVGLVCLTGGDEGPLAQALNRGGSDAGHKLLEQLIALFGHENVYVELQRHYNRTQESAIRQRSNLHVDSACRY